MDIKSTSNSDYRLRKARSVERNLVFPERRIYNDKPPVESYKKFTAQEKKFEDIQPLIKQISVNIIENYQKPNINEVAESKQKEIYPLELLIEKTKNNNKTNDEDKKSAKYKIVNFNKIPNNLVNTLRTAISKKHRLAINYILISAVVLATGYIFYDVWSTNTNLKKDLVTTVSALGAPNAEARQSKEGRDETPVKSDDITSYVVAPSFPKILNIEKIGVRARVLPMDLNPDNSVQAPINVNDSGWYTGSAKPGEPGIALIDGHVSGPTGKGLLSNLSKLALGDRVEIERGDGVKLIYEVIQTETIKKEDVDMDRLLIPLERVSQGLNIITCAGTYIKEDSTYDQRLIVYTKLVNQG